MALHDDPTKSRTTTDHREIREWIEARGGHPARVKGDEGHPAKARAAAILRIDFGAPEEGLERISWGEFSDTFDKNHLSLLYQEEAKHGGTSRFFKFVRDGEGKEGSDGNTLVDDDDDDADYDADETELDEEGRQIIEDVDGEADTDEGSSGRKEANHEAAGEDLP